MSFYALLIGTAVFLCIGVFHLVVIKAEYWFGKHCWWVFLLVGGLALAESVFVKADVGSISVVGVRFFVFLEYS